MDFFSTDISQKKEFSFQGDTLVFDEYVPEYGKYIYKRFNPRGVLVGWEIVKPVKHTNPDGSIVNTYPSTEQFGKYAWSLPPRTTRTEMIPYLDGTYKERWRKS